MSICTVHLLHSLYIRHLTKEREGGPIVYSARGPITLSVRPCYILGKFIMQIQLIWAFRDWKISLSCWKWFGSRRRIKQFSIKLTWGPSQMKKFRGTVKIKSGALDIFPNAKAPACNFFQNNYQQTFWHNERCMLLSIFWPTAQTGWHVSVSSADQAKYAKYNTFCCLWLNGQLLESSDSNTRSASTAGVSNSFQFQGHFRHI